RPSGGRPDRRPRFADSDRALSADPPAGGALKVIVNGKAVEVADGDMLSAAVALAGVTTFRRSATGEPRGPLCGMGICFECRVTVNGRAHVRSCQVPCRPGMEVRTDD